MKESKLTMQKFDYLENKKVFLDKIKSIFHNFDKDFLFVRYRKVMDITLSLDYIHRNI